MIKNIKFLGLLLFLFTLAFQACDETEEVLPYAKTVKPVFSSLSSLTNYIDHFNLETTATGINLNTEGDLAANSNVVDVYVRFKREAEESFGDRFLLESANSLPVDLSWTAQKLSETVGVDFNSLLPDDAFLLSFEVTGSDGNKYPSEDTHQINVECSSDLAGTYEATTTYTETATYEVDTIYQVDTIMVAPDTIIYEINTAIYELDSTRMVVDDCLLDTMAATIMASSILIEETSTRTVYDISDFSGGLWSFLYADELCGIDEEEIDEDFDPSDTSGEFIDECNAITFQNTVDVREQPITGTGTYDPETQTITIEWAAEGIEVSATTVYTKVP